MLVESTFSPLVRSHCERVISESLRRRHGRHKPRILFSLHPNSSHFETWSSPPQIAVRNGISPYETAIAGPTVELDLGNFLSDSRKRVNSGDRRSFENRRHHREILAMISDLEVDADTKLAILEEIVCQVEKSIEKTRMLFEVGEERFDLKVTVKVSVSTVRRVLEVFDEEDDDDIRDSDDDFDFDFNDDGLDSMVPAAEKAIEGLEKVRVSEDGIVTRESHCLICLEDYEVGTEVCRLKCSHVFHSHCLHVWLKTSHYCPLCRFKLPTQVD